MIGSLSLMQPALLWGLTAALVPVLIHLLLRPRPRRLRFPALALMRAALTSGQRANRLRNILLMLLRAAVLACAALLLAAPTCTPAAGDFGGSRPIACVVVVDDSLSMGYRPRFDDHTTLLDQARAGALMLLEASQAWPAGSELAVLRAGGDNSAAALTSNRNALAQVLRDPDRGTPHAQPLGEALRATARLLRSADQPDRRIVVFTDVAASAWRDVRPAILSGISDLAVRIVGPPAGRRTNLALTSASPPPQVWPASAPTPVRVNLSAAGVGGECWLVARQEREVLVRAGPLKLAADTSREITLRIPPLPSGPRTVTLELEPEDLLAFDQKRYVAWQTGPQPVVWLLTTPGWGPDKDLSALIFRNLLAPELLSPQQQRVAIRIVQAAQLAELGPQPPDEDSDAEPRRPPALMIVFPNVELTSTERDALLWAIEAGSTALLVLASNAPAPDWPGLRSLLSEAMPEDQTLASDTAIRWEATSAGAPLDDDLRELSRCSVRRRVRLVGLLEGVRTLASYADGVPAIVSRRLGRGRVLALTTSPDPQWSDLGVRAAGLLTWLHSAVDEALGPPTAASQFTAGQTPDDAFASLPAGGLVYVSVQAEAEREPTWVRLSAGRPRQPWPTNIAGIYTVRATGGAGGTALYAVNWPAEESDLTPISHAELVRTLGTEQVTLARPDDASVGVSSGWLRRLLRISDFVRPLGLALLLLFLVEMALATRRRAWQPAAV